MSADLAFSWLRDPQLADVGTVDATLFLPAEIVAEMAPPVASPVAGNRVEIELAGGHLMRIGGHDPEAPARLIRGLTA